MPEARIKATVRKWGNTYGIRISKRDMERLGIQEGAEVTAVVSTEPAPPDMSRFPVFYGPDEFGSRDHDRLFGESVAKRKGL